MRIEPVFLFDLDGTLVDSLYQHVLAWKKALDAEQIDLAVWRIHRKIRHERRSIRQPVVARDRPRDQPRTRRAAQSAARRSL